jgi:hypothetical protein
MIKPRTKGSRSRNSAKGVSTLPSSIVLPSPFAHHSFEWKPLPENVTHNRSGASLAGRFFFGSSPHTLTDSIHGSAMVTPVPRRKARRQKLVAFHVHESLVGGDFFPSHLAELPTAHDLLDERAKA